MAKKELTFKEAVKNLGTATSDVAVVTKKNAIEAKDKTVKVTTETVIPAAKEGYAKSRDVVEKSFDFTYPKLKASVLYIWSALLWLYSNSIGLLLGKKEKVKPVSKKKTSSKKKVSTKKKIAKKALTKK